MNAPALPPAWALATIVAVAAVVGALYLLKPPPRRLLIPSSLIWERVLRHSHRRSDRWRWWLSLLLALLIAVALAASAARLQLRGGAADAAGWMLVVDNSATMATRTTDGASRWEHARARARALLRSRPAGTEVVLVDTMRTIPVPGFESRDAALQRLARLRLVHGGRPQVPEVPQAAKVESVVITDGVRLTAVPPSARTESVFEPVENVGIVAFEVRPLPSDPRRQQAFVDIANAGGTDKDVEVALVGVAGKRTAKTLSIPAGGSRHALIDASDFEGGPVRASLVMPGDGLAADDVAYSLLPMRRVVRVTLVSNGSPYLEHSLRAQPRVRLSVVPPRNYGDRGDVDAWVFDRFAPKTPPVAPCLLFRPGPADWLPPASPETAVVTPETWDAAHPLLQNLSLRDLVVDRAVPARPRAKDVRAGTALVRTRDGAALMTVHEDGARWIWLAFRVEDSNFALQAGFPVFLGNAVDWMAGEREAYDTGLGLVEIPAGDARVITADGSELAAQAVPGGTIVEIAQPGLLTAVSAHRRMRIAANVLDRQITDVNRTALAASGAGAQASEPVSGIGGFDPWALVLLAAALALAFEWWSWNRRITV